VVVEPAESVNNTVLMELHLIMVAVVAVVHIVDLLAMAVMVVVVMVDRIRSLDIVAL
jgi:hypothetical protein